MNYFNYTHDVSAHEQQVIDEQVAKNRRAVCFWPVSTYIFVIILLSSANSNEQLILSLNNINDSNMAYIVRNRYGGADFANEGFEFAWVD